MGEQSGLTESQVSLSSLLASPLINHSCFLKAMFSKLPITCRVACKIGIIFLMLRSHQPAL